MKVKTLRKEPDTKHECPQVKCAFNVLGVGCRKCEGCSCEPFIVDDNCEMCWTCAGDEGVLRWDNNKLTEKETVKEKEIKEEVGYVR